MLEVRDLEVAYDDTEVVHGVSFDVNDGEHACVIRANGCRKTTTLKAVLGLHRPESGTVLVDGCSTTGLSEREMAKKFAYIPQIHRPISKTMRVAWQRRATRTRVAVIEVLRSYTGWLIFYAFSWRLEGRRTCIG